MLVKKFCLIGLFGAVIMLTLFFPFVERALTYDHGMAYSAYAGGHDVITIIRSNFLHLGSALCVILAFALLASLRYEKVRVLTVLLTVWIATSIILISRIQIMGTHHYYTVLVPMVIITAATIMISFRRNKKICTILVLLLTFNFAHSYSGISAFDMVSNEVFKYTPRTP